MREDRRTASVPSRTSADAYRRRRRAGCVARRVSGRMPRSASGPPTAVCVSARICFPNAAWRCDRSQVDGGVVAS